MARLGWSLHKGPWCSGLLPRWTQVASFSKLLASLVPDGHGCTEWFWGGGRGKGAFVF